MKAWRSRRAAPVVALLAGGWLAALLGPGVAGAQDPGGGPEATAVTSGRVEAETGNPNGLRLACSWVLADVDGDWSNGMTYVAEPFVGDATPNVRPFEEPCTGPPADQPRLGSAPQVDVLPLPRGEGTVAYAELWAMVELLSNPDDADNPLQVSFEVRRPDGSVAFTAEGARYGDCRGPADMLDAAVATGQVAPAVVRPAADRPDSFAERCDRRGAYLVFAAVPIATSEPWGPWSVSTRVADGVASDEAVTSFDVLPVLDVRLDTASVDWPGVKRSQAARVEGDLALDTPERPTVVSRGNVGVGVEVQFGPACLVGTAGSCDTPGRRIDRFGAGLRVGDGTRVVVGEAPPASEAEVGDLGGAPVGPGTAIGFTRSGALQRGQVLCANDRGQLDLVRFATADQQAGVYAGPVEVRAVPVPGGSGAAACPTDAGAPYAGSAEYNAYRPDPTLVSVDHWRR